MVPVLMEGGGWKASGWHGLLTAGSLWVPLYEERDFEVNVRQLHGQLMKTIRNAAAAEEEDEEGEDEEEEGMVTAAAAIEELERLREAQTASRNRSVSVLADPSGLATIPAGVPKLPARFQTTEQIRELARLVLSPSEGTTAMHRVGFFGMGEWRHANTGSRIY